MSESETARIFGDRYVLGNRLTAAADREVWQAHDDVVSRPVALKIFFGPNAADPEWQAGFRHRADRLVALSNPGIAKVYDHGESTAECWLAMAFVRGTPLGARLRDSAVPAPADALDIVGQTALALAAAHSAGVVHGRLSADSLLIRDSGVVAIVGFAVDSSASPSDDLAALGVVAAAMIDPATLSMSAPADDVRTFMTTFGGGERRRDERAPDAADVGRSALALAAALRAGTAASGWPDPAPAAPVPSRAAERAEVMQQETEQAAAARKMVRNRLIVLGTIVVVGGAALLRFVGEGAGDVTVPQVTSLTLDQAELKLTTDGMRSHEQCLLGSSSGGVVTQQTPSPGRSVKAGSVVTLTYTKDTCP